MSALLEMRAVSKAYGEGPARVDALTGVDLRVEAGELVAVMGPSGSGKSTLLTIAGTLEEPSEGTVLIDGVAVATLQANARARPRRRTIGYVFQSYNLLAGLTATENVALPLELDGVRARAAHRAAKAVLDDFGLAQRADRFPDELSGGEAQRVAIARAVVGARRLLLADEPTGALDSRNGELVMRVLRSTCRRGVAGIIVTHDAQLAAWADRVIFVRDGHIARETAVRDSPDSLLQPNPKR